MTKPQAPSANLVGEELPEDRSKVLFLDCLLLVERLHRRMLDVIKETLDREGLSELNAVQALLIYNIGDSETTAGELKTRGYYLGSNVSYNLKKLVELGYLSHERAEHDRRAVRISVTDRGKQVCRVIDTLYEQDLEELLSDQLISVEDLRGLRRNLRNIERYWSDKLRFSL
ncbi:MarR family transcriptional regulator [Rhodothalassium salexigens]|uniref:MarR family winged helix-turn-helix transcriptional regulator n=1 Tax=Rhodothalassium salexigens TaxID=1086 RepID=UPI0019119031|nr:winged helix DNA-binding protein [Rhodothalassium salexigens]MBK5910692.1 MarR family transcriptional regulator [Rhodothalassium salexigens]MBK5920062.1 MarR family transcriptional regulator [Rhodothalassium salexigens]